MKSSLDNVMQGDSTQFEPIFPIVDVIKKYVIDKGYWRPLAMAIITYIALNGLGFIHTSAGLCQGKTKKQIEFQIDQELDNKYMNKIYRGCTYFGRNTAYWLNEQGFDSCEFVPNKRT